MFEIDPIHTAQGWRLSAPDFPASVYVEERVNAESLCGLLNLGLSTAQANARASFERLEQAGQETEKPDDLVCGVCGANVTTDPSGFYRKTCTCEGVLYVERQDYEGIGDSLRTGVSPALVCPTCGTKAVGNEPNCACAAGLTTCGEFSATQSSPPAPATEGETD